MFLVNSDGFLIFLVRDPRHDGCDLEVEENVSYDDGNVSHIRKSGDDLFETGATGKDPCNPKLYRRFQTVDELKSSGFIPVTHKAIPLVYDSWPAYLQVRKYPPKTTTR